MEKRQGSKKVIGFDMDGVIIDHTKNKIRAAKKFGVFIKKEEAPSDIIQKKFSHPLYEQFRHYLYNDLAIKFKPDLIPGVSTVLNKINNRKIQFYLISRQKNPGVASGILKYHKLWPKYFNEKNTFFVKEVEDKDVEAKKLGITHYIDDEQKVLKVLLSVKNKFLFDRFGAFPDSEFKRVASWKDIAELI